MPKTLRKTKSFLTSILIDFWLQLGCPSRNSSATQALKNRYFFELGLGRRPRTRKRHPKTSSDGQDVLQESKKMSRERPKSSQEGPRTAPRQPKSWPRRPQDDSYHDIRQKYRSKAYRGRLPRQCPRSAQEAPEKRPRAPKKRSR